MPPTIAPTSDEDPLEAAVVLTIVEVDDSFVVSVETTVVVTAEVTAVVNSVGTVTVVDSDVSVTLTTEGEMAGCLTDTVVVVPFNSVETSTAAEEIVVAVSLVPCCFSGCLYTLVVSVLLMFATLSLSFLLAKKTGGVGIANDPAANILGGSLWTLRNTMELK